MTKRRVREEEREKEGDRNTGRRGAERRKTLRGKRKKMLERRGKNNGMKSNKRMEENSFVVKEEKFVQ